MSRRSYPNTMSYGSDVDTEFRILVIGKAGNGKSTLCNAIIGEKKFAVGRGMSTTTFTAEFVSTFRGNKKIKVIDTPDITNCEMDAAAMREEVSKWRRLTVPRPDAVILTVRCDIRYTAEEFAIYQQVVKLWGDNSLKEKLVVAFTFGDCQDEPIEEELKTVCPELKIVLRDAGNVYFVFDKTSEQSRSGVDYEVVDAIQRKERARRTDTAGRDRTNSFPISSRSISSRIVPILVGVLLIAVIGCIIFSVLKIVGAAIGFGVLGIIVAAVLLLLVYGKKKNQSLLRR